MLRQILDRLARSPGNAVTPRGRLAVTRLPARPVVTSARQALWHGQRWLAWRPGMTSPLSLEWQRANQEHFVRSLDAMRRADAGCCAPVGFLWGTVLRADGRSEDLGLMSCRVVTDAGVGYLVDSLQGLVEPENMRYHALGTSSTAESAGQTALVSELTTQYSPANTRPTGSLGEKAGDAKTFETVATITVSTSVAATEHAVMSQAATGGGTMLDRSVFAAVNLGASESIATTYQLTLPSGS